MILSVFEISRVESTPWADGGLAPQPDFFFNEKSVIASDAVDRPELLVEVVEQWSL